jgi:hypothetical protein
MVEPKTLVFQHGMGDLKYFEQDFDRRQQLLAADQLWIENDT